MGKFNAYNRHQNNTQFQAQMLHYSQTFPGVDFANIPPPSIETLTIVYDGPVVAVSMFALAGQRHVITSTKRAQQNKMSWNRTNHNILFLSGRKHIQAIGLECGSKLKKGMGHCGNRDPNDHRCVGPRGGHPDLLAWDIIEAIHTLVSPSS
jgi:hypothetical protein